MNIKISPRFLMRSLTAMIVAPISLWLIIRGGMPFLALLTFFASLALYEWFKLSLKSRHKYLFILLGILYIGLSFTACYFIRTDHGLVDSCIFIGMIWASDIGAYATGKLLKGPKLAPNISPNKTWAGLAGAIIFPVILSLLSQLIFADGRDVFLFVLITAIGVIVGVTGQAGDLLISLFKRHVQVKDSGDMMPGHGGVLDRIDSLLLAAPVYLGIVCWIESLGDKIN